MNDKSTLYVISLAWALPLAGGGCVGSLPQGTGSGGRSGTGGNINGTYAFCVANLALLPK
jgi:hypothetical protein